ncbi:hypothetical protein CEXT_277681 [Caerostris extrusa]|uniref:Uncharacterized protein n=1 Tax=Caerostris extrusa TaxID=172846 RepID=A0AAV4NGX4_CAEEX|nr:hypothetical protein CEXT_277681 [Caerostris extrusa]
MPRIHYEDLLSTLAIIFLMFCNKREAKKRVCSVVQWKRDAERFAGVNILLFISATMDGGKIQMGFLAFLSSCFSASSVKKYFVSSAKCRGSIIETAENSRHYVLNVLQQARR